MMFSIVPPALPVLKQPAFIPPTVAGPMITFPRALALAVTNFIRLSGTPSAIITIVRICGMANASSEEGAADLNDAKLIITSTLGCIFAAFSMVLYIGTRISRFPKKNFEKLSAPVGVIIDATDGVLRPAA